MMKNVMLVDDEKLIRDGLKVLIDFESLNLCVKEEASNGLEALEKVKNNNIDIIITDINMPNMTGLEFIRELREINKDIKIVILSGYDDFSYAKKAICYGVSDYLLKPINEEELEEVLKNIVIEIEKSEKKKVSHINKNREILELLRGDIKNIDELKESLDIDLNGKSYIVASITLSKGGKIISNVDLNKIFKNNNIEKYEIAYVLERRFLVVKEWDKDVKTQEVLEHAYKLKELCNKEYELDAFIGIGSVVSSIEDISKSYKEAIDINKYMLTEGTNICLCKENLRCLDSTIKTFELDFQRINKKIIEKNFEESKEHIEKMFRRNDLTPKDIYDFSIGILFMLYKISEEFKIEGKGYNKESLSSTMVELCTESTTESIEKFLISEIENVISNMYVGTTKYSPVVQQIVTYVNEKYYEELSLKVLSSKYNINSSYLGQLFIKEVGMSFSDYLNGVKNAKAKEFLLETNMRINDIAKKVGFIDTSYFYRKFKKYYGVSPSVLRELKNY
ncbi:MAG: response regulator [Clostridium sp.]|uniref:response regulator n=1 Tax=Clostridium sp. TaxID=1506 RepID=UPI003EE7C778